jgi:chaperonin cofactor prefoldin
MALNHSTAAAILELQEVIGDTGNYIDKLQRKMDDISELKDNLETYQGEAQKALEALEELSADELTDSLDEAENLVG